MAAPRITFHQITIITLCFGIACSIASCATRAWKSGGLFDLPNEAWANTIKAFAIIGVAMLGFSLFMEILMVASNTFKLSRAMHLLCFICCLLSAASLLISLGLYSRHYSYGGYSVWLLTAGTVFALEAFFFYTIQWRCT
ncbi:hypothetical protein BOX15_Mlig016342g1 [Macrostomum lignano]|uniref:MARVEL domain-containing protein n=1 Tax=Macrostomum lignano TaxID=282301 RepID=A0A267EGW5_9PLAT|nr:hypothetical protein BOX15_Mlig016342g1 [Macrostomum lignano]